jgi:dipeptidyl aminopeptidase B
MAYAQGYLDVLPTPEGFNHIAYFASNVSAPVWITEGAWEITNGIEAIDLRRGLVYFTAANPSIERHIYSAALPLPTLTQSELSSFKPKVTPLTDASRPGYYSASFSPKVGYYVLSSLGPEVPYQKIVSIENKSGSSPSHFIIGR